DALPISPPASAPAGPGGDRAGPDGGMLVLVGPATRSYSTFMRLAISCSGAPCGWEQARRVPVSNSCHDLGRSNSVKVVFACVDQAVRRVRLPCGHRRP